MNTVIHHMDCFMTIYSFRACRTVDTLCSPLGKIRLEAHISVLSAAAVTAEVVAAKAAEAAALSGSNIPLGPLNIDCAT